MDGDVDMDTTITEQRLKELVRQAVTEALEERADFLQAVLSEALEDLGLVRAVEEGLRTEPVDEDRIRTLLHPGR
jgi:elongation factor P hydroxylase